MSYKFNPFTGNFDIVGSASGGTGDPGGSTTQVQFNDSGAFGGDSTFTFNKTTDTLTVANLVTTGNTTLGDASGDTVALQAGTAALPTLIPAGDPDTGLWFPAANTVALSTSGTERVRIDSVGTMGLGTTPASWFNLSTLRAFQIGPTCAVSSYDAGGGNVQASFSNNLYDVGINPKYITDSSAGSYTLSRGNHFFRYAALGTAGNTATLITGMALDAGTGHLAIGQTTPADRLDVAGGNVRFRQSSNAANTSVIFNTATQNALTLDSSGNLGIGATVFGTSAAKALSIATGTAPTTGPADTIQIYSTDLSAGNTMLSVFTEGTCVNANTTAAATHRIAVRINGTVYYLLANTAA